MHTIKTMFALTTAFFLSVFPHSARAEDVRIGFVNGLSGPIAETAQDILKVSRAYVEQVNASGGVHGRKLVLVARDDQYDPGKTAALVEDVIVNDKVVALVNSAGTAPIIAVIKSGVLAHHKVPLVGVFSGSAALRGPGSAEIFHTRPTYGEEVLKIARLASTLGLRRIAVLYQEDAFGQGILQSVAEGEKKFNLEVILKAGYHPGTRDFAAQAKAIVAAHPQAVFMMGVPDSTYQFVKAWDAPTGYAQLYTLSFVTSQKLAEIAGEAKARGIGISQVVPNPNSTVLPLMKDYQSLLRSFYGKDIPSNPVTLEGYLNIRLVVEAIKAAGPNPSGDKVMQALAAMRDFRLGGYPIDFSGSKRTGSNYLDIAVVGRDARLLY
ncbi:MAG TPA: ABC transporter substrate-binding protein [Noviherbaspirillum sp.]|uniref:ABC transporter substrate-binding protein n=1 Tax=Noviherbaspirillum sp. TaxID=1926288 RepID=UPI002B49EA45|nr:ABC transporter substrate-binding protein [Noviherbaspirillum sp.]HJV86469.1 ABC transporter substrate-binding protein [Noviherbaspirillum sp.]